MIPIVSIVGKSDSGKTFLIERLVSGLTAKGYRIATIKHDVHGFEMDREGKDSWRHKQAGASAVVISSPKKIAMIQDVEEEESLETIRDAWIRNVDLILTDVVMPIMSGPELVAQILDNRPDLPALFMSGYTDDILNHHGFSIADVHLLRKPFSSAQLVDKVRQAI